MNELLTADQVAALLNVKPQTVYQWVKSGIIPSIRITENCLRFDGDQIKQWLDEHKSFKGVK